MSINKKLIVVFFSLFISKVLIACNLLAMIALAGTDLTDISQSKNYDFLNNSLSIFKNQAYANPNGWGLLYYNEVSQLNAGEGSEHFTRPDGESSISFKSLRWAQNLRANELYSLYDICTDSLKMAKPKLILGHLRSASSGPSGIINPHPWVYQDPSKLRTYSFAHNGYCTSDTLMMSIYVRNYLKTHEDQNLKKLINQEVDSGKYFAYIMVKIIDNQWDILRGINSALNNLVSDKDDNLALNFIMSDSRDLYAYKFSNNNTKKLSYIFLQDYKYNNQSTSSYNLGMIMTNMSAFPEPLNSIIIKERTEMSNDEFLCLPAFGQFLSIKNFSTLNKKQWLVKQKRCSSSQYSVWNWLGFPILRDLEDDAIASLSQENINSDFIYSGNGFDNALKVLRQNDLCFANCFNNVWNYTSAPVLLNPYIGIKLQTNGEGEALISGTLSPIQSGVSLIPGNSYWLTYELMNSQSLKEALGNNFNKIDKVWAEDWYYDSNEEFFKSDLELVIKNSGRAMEFGKFYIIKLKANSESIFNFQWANSFNHAQRGSNNQRSDVFFFTEDYQYQSLEIIISDEYKENYQEIAIFDGECCLGASKINSNINQVQIYTRGHERRELRIRLLNRQNIISELNGIYEIYNFNTSQFYDEYLYADETAYKVIRLPQISISNPVISDILSLSNYPNPFRSLTNIRMQLNNDARAEIKVFNIKGELIKTVFSGCLKAGLQIHTWDGKDRHKQKIASGVYFIKVSTDNSSKIIKCLYLRE